MPSRRAFLTAGAAVVGAAAIGGVLVEERVVPGRARLHDVLGLDGPAGTIPGVGPGPLVSGTFKSVRRRAPTGWTVAYPPGAADTAALPVLVVLHGKGDDHRTTFDDLGFDSFLAAAVNDGVSPFAIASVDGGTTYWHARRDGSDAGAMVTDEFVPLLGERGLDVERIGLLGWSMGGYGALLLAGTGALAHLRVVSTMSAALWTSPDATAPGAFDDAHDFAAHDVFSMRTDIARIPLRMDCGDDDPFRSANDAFVDGLTPRPEGGFEAGTHSRSYWRRMASAQLAFVGRHLTA